MIDWFHELILIKIINDYVIIVMIAIFLIVALVMNGFIQIAFDFSITFLIIIGIGLIG